MEEETQIVLTPEDLRKVGPLAAHCDLEKLKMATNEAVLFDMEPVFCAFWQEVETNWSGEDETWRAFIDGSAYEGCNGKTRRHRGLKTALSYFAYSRYVMINGFNDTATGTVSKTNAYSIPKPLKELQAFSNKYRNMGNGILEGTLNFLCLNRETFSGYDGTRCTDCGCAGECGSRTNTKGFGLRVKNIGKWDA